MAGMFGNKYDTLSEINKGIDTMGMQWGQLSQKKYAGMAAAEGMMGYMSGLGSPNNDPRMAGQNVLDELMRAHPDPKTPEELEALAADLQARGFNDHAFKVREVATALKVSASEVAKNALPKDSAYKSLGTYFQNKVLSPEMLDAYLAGKNPALAKPYVKNDAMTYTQYQAEKDRHKEYLQGYFSNWATSKQDEGMSKTELGQLKGNTINMTDSFLNYIDANADVETSAFFTQMMRSDKENKVLDGDTAPVDNQTEVLQAQINNMDAETVTRMIENLEKRDPESLSVFEKAQLNMLEEKIAGDVSWMAN